MFFRMPALFHVATVRPASSFVCQHVLAQCAIFASPSQASSEKRLICHPRDQERFWRSQCLISASIAQVWNFVVEASYEARAKSFSAVVRWKRQLSASLFLMHNCPSTIHLLFGFLLHPQRDRFCFSLLHTAAQDSTPLYGSCGKRRTASHLPTHASVSCVLRTLSTHFLALKSE